MMAEWQCCPVCLGRGLVPQDFYSVLEMDFSGSANFGAIKCRTCHGPGVIPIQRSGYVQVGTQDPLPPATTTHNCTECSAAIDAEFRFCPHCGEEQTYIECSDLVETARMTEMEIDEELNKNLVCMFCEGAVEPAPTNDGWIRLTYSRALHLRCIDRLTDLAASIRRSANPLEDISSCDNGPGDDERRRE